jgi:hypothetical protein
VYATLRLGCSEATSVERLKFATLPFMNIYGKKEPVII